jgi:hypothetical protein
VEETAFGGRRHAIGRFERGDEVRDEGGAPRAVVGTVGEYVVAARAFGIEEDVDERLAVAKGAGRLLVAAPPSMTTAEARDLEDHGPSTLPVRVVVGGQGDGGFDRRRSAIVRGEARRRHYEFLHPSRFLERACRDDGGRGQAGTHGGSGDDLERHGIALQVSCAAADRASTEIAVEDDLCFPRAFFERREISREADRGGTAQRHGLSGGQVLHVEREHRRRVEPDRRRVSVRVALSPARNTARSFR